MHININIFYTAKPNIIHLAVNDLIGQFSDITDVWPIRSFSSINPNTVKDMKAFEQKKTNLTKGFRFVCLATRVFS